MYEEWMDSVPICVKGCYRHNVTEYNRAVYYYERQGNKKEAEYYREAANKELEKQREEDSLTFVGKLLKKIMYK